MKNDFIDYIVKEAEKENKRSLKFIEESAKKSKLAYERFKRAI